MKKNVFKYWIGLVMSMVVAVVFTACHPETNAYDPNYFVKKKNAEYSQQFEKTFGKIASNHDWGFGEDVATTRSVNVNGNLWYQDWERPTNITDDERTKVVAEFSKERRNAVNTVNITWKNYWVQQVYKGEAGYHDGNWKNVSPGSDYMNKLVAYNSNLVEEVYWPVRETKYGGYEHVNNFNAGNNTTEYTDDVTHQKYIGTTLMYNMATDGRVEQFGYHNSIDSKDHFEYIVLEIDGAYYVGFDFYAHGTDLYPANHNMDVERDWIFNDWIVKISPAYHKGESPVIVYDKRIICEDLGSIGDWDFNDVVFDAKIDKANNKTYIKLLAAGGTMRLTVANVEVHEAFGVDVKTMVNTGIVSKPVYEFVVDQSYNSYADIPIAIEDDKTADQLIRYALKYTIGGAPQKICVDTDYEWCTEKLSIDDMYPAFKDYVGDPNLKHDWYRRE